MIYRLAQNLELVERDGESFLLSRTPLVLLRLNGSLAELVRRGLAGPISAASTGETAVLEQLVAKGFAERITSSPVHEEVLPGVSIVIPVKDRADELERCLASLANIDYPLEKIEVIVVDDGSRDDSPLVARRFGAHVVPSGGTGRGPAAARNVGARAAGKELLAFIDSDCTASPEWLRELIPAFNDAKTAAVGGNVAGMCTVSGIDRYEAVMSSLSLGSRERFGSSGDDTFYLPSCNLLLRRTVFLGAGGFEDSMHVGEDVDLTWRLRDGGWTIAYLPMGTVFHEHRSTLRSFMSRRFDYGTSEGLLQRLHPHRRKRMVIPPLLATVLALCLIAPFARWWPLAAAMGILTVDTMVVRLRFARRGLPFGPVALLSGRLRALGSLVYYLSYHLIRYYSIPLIAGALFFPLFRLAFIATLGCAAGVDHAIKKPNLAFVRFVGIYLLEQLAYGAGVFRGCLSRRCFSSYRVVIMRHMEVTSS
jgi:mycofactocin glycosyltransferase